jgi:phosphopantothenoylcysteine decarboxylase/phosphopantothenate--cysteine ligase
MNCIVTAGPTYEPLDEARRLTNFSTGRLGTELANYLAAHGHHVTLLIGQQATYSGERKAQRVETFTTTTNLRDLIQAYSTQDMGAVFHAAAVSDFLFGKIWSRDAQGTLTEIRSKKISSFEGSLVAELLPTPKIIAQLRVWYPAAFLAGWKHEFDGTRSSVVDEAERQLRECLTDVCIANGPAYGEGFGLVTGAGRCTHLAGHDDLFAALEQSLHALKR